LFHSRTLSRHPAPAPVSLSGSDEQESAKYATAGKDNAMAEASEQSTDEQMSSDASHSRDEDEAGMGMEMGKGGGGGQVMLRDGEIADLWLESEGADVACFAVHPQGNFIAVGRLDGAVYSPLLPSRQEGQKRAAGSRGE